MNELIPAAGRDVETKDNRPDYAAETSSRLAREYENTSTDVDAILDDAREQPKSIDDDDTALSMGAVVKRIRDLDDRVESYRNLEKEPHLRSGNAIDAFFFALRDRLRRRDKKAKAGAADILQARIDDYQRRKLLEEQRKREEARRVAEEEQRRADAAAAEAVRQAQEAQAAAARARNPERKEEKEQVAAVAVDVANKAIVDATLAQGEAMKARVDTFAKPADIVRTRGDEGVTLTMKTEPFAIVEDETKLDKVALWPFISSAEKEKALRAWAKNTGYTQTMEGASVGKRPTSVIR